MSRARESIKVAFMYHNSSRPVFLVISRPAEDVIHFSNSLDLEKLQLLEVCAKLYLSGRLSLLRLFSFLLFELWIRLWHTICKWFRGSDNVPREGKQTQASRHHKSSYAIITGANFNSLTDYHSHFSIFDRVGARISISEDSMTVSSGENRWNGNLLGASERKNQHKLLGTIILVPPRGGTMQIAQAWVWPSDGTRKNKSGERYWTWTAVAGFLLIQAPQNLFALRWKVDIGQGRPSMMDDTSLSSFSQCVIEIWRRWDDFSGTTLIPDQIGQEKLLQVLWKAFTPLCRP